MTDNNIRETVTIRRALISAWRKGPAVKLAKELVKREVSIIASGGTADALDSAGIKVERLSKKIGFNNLLGGRVKTLHPAVYASILARRDSENDLKDIAEFDIEPVDLVAVDLYPFTEHRDSEEDTNVELIDIGGVSLIRAAAKNFRYLSVLSSADQFENFITDFSSNDCRVPIEHRRKLAIEAFNLTSYYDSIIARDLKNEDSSSELGEIIEIRLERLQKLRYGENPHQAASFYIPVNRDKAGIAVSKQLGGKQLSFNNLLDLDTALRLPREFEQPAAAVLKHTTPCGVGRGKTLLQAFQNALSTDPQSAFGGIVGLNRVVDLDTAVAIRKGFVEVVCAPGFKEDALQHFRKSKNLRIIEFDGEMSEDEVDMRTVWGGMLVEKRDFGFPEFEDLKFATERKPTEKQIKALRFAWKCVRYVKSNAILLASNERTIGIGAGQMSRVDAAYIAVWKAKQAGLTTEGAVAASDAFFPFRDGVDMLADAGISAVIQPGGSIRDEEVINAANERGIVMVLTGRRHFRH